MITGKDHVIRWLIGADDQHPYSCAWGELTVEVGLIEEEAAAAAAAKKPTMAGV